MTYRLAFRRALWFIFISALVLTGCREKNDRAPTDQTSDDAALEAMQVIEERVSELRGLEPLQPVTKAFLTPDELRQRIEEDFFEDYSEQDAHDDVLL